MNLFVSTTLIYLINCANYAAAVKSTIPVFMIDQEQVMAHVHVDPNPFAKMTNAKFNEIISDSFDRSTGVVIFVEETFSVEDISMKDVVYGTPYVNLHGALKANRDTLKYFPSVMDPYTVLQKVFPKIQSNVHYLARNSKLRLKNNFRHLYIFFNDGADEPRLDILKRHDTIIKEIVAATRRLKAGPIIAYYTGKRNPVAVKRVEYVKPNTIPEDPGFFISSPLTLLHISDISTSLPTRRSLQRGKPTVGAEMRASNEQNITYEFDQFKLKWRFILEPDYWIIDSIAFFEENEETGRVSLEIKVPYNHSYYCPEPIMITNTRDGNVVILTGILVEPKNITSNEEKQQFSPSVHCYPYFSPTALSVLFVVFLLLTITMYGIVMMFDLAANDRYEDPDSKPLVHETMH